MTRPRASAWEIKRAARARRDGAIAREELRGPSQPRVAPSGVTSAPIKTEDAATRAMIDAALEARRGGV